MSSGLYSALSGALTKMQSLENLANNLTNASTFGFKKDRCSFESLLDDARQNTVSKGMNFTRIRDSFTDWSEGVTQPTGNTFDFAIEGEGFFKVKGEQGVFYSRLGSFRPDIDGNLMTASGLQVLDDNDKPIVLPDTDVIVEENGMIIDSEGGEVAQIGLFAIDDSGLLEKRGAGLFVLPDEVEARVIETPRLVQGHLESSNVNSMQEVTLMMDALRSFEAFQKVIKTYGSLAEKANEIGTL